ncbi:hypothetical protein GTK63_00775 [Lactobacillus crispatus]|uniref:Uncharacterized protein n=1 Tax=Lactobacillus crispatus TaxID=47770 RepID=A0A7X4HL98_9LACO|nr:hypothetical protein [Lactobacillus crispatus]MYN52874.1 hypothetical protein [Lactobacillus crispatus]
MKFWSLVSKLNKVEANSIFRICIIDEHLMNEIMLEKQYAGIIWKKASNTNTRIQNVFYDLLDNGINNERYYSEWYANYPEFFKGQQLIKEVYG